MLTAQTLISALLVVSSALSQDPVGSNRAETQQQIAALQQELEHLAGARGSRRELALHNQLGPLLQDVERFSESRQHFERGVVLARKLGERQLLLVHLANLAITDFHLGELERSLRFNEEAMTLAELLDRPDRIWALANNAGTAHLKLGDYAAAAEAFSRALEVQPDEASVRSLGMLLSNLAVAHMYLGALDDALDLLDRALPLMEEANDTEGIAAVLSNQGDVHHLCGDNELALDLQREALELREEYGTEGDVANSLQSLGAVLGQLGRAEESLEALQQALEIQRRLGLKVELVGTLSTLAEVYAGLDRGEEAAVAAMEGLELAEAMRMRAGQLANLESLSEAHEASGDLDEALAVARKASVLERELASLEVTRALAESQNRFEAELRERELALLRKDNRLQSQQRNLFVVGSVALAGLALLGWVCFLAKRRVLRRLEAVSADLVCANQVAQERTEELERAMAEIKNLEEERLRAGRLESISILAAGIAHDFNNILTALLGNVSVARESLADRPQEQSILDDAIVAVDQASRLAGQLLAFSKGGEPRRELQDMKKLIRDASSFASSGSNSRLCFDIDQDLWPALVDSGQFSQVMGNLILNAQQAMPGGGTVAISAHNVSDPYPRVCIRVRDSGSGIPEEARDKIFDPYFTTKDRGHGLGLTTAYAIVNRHGGTFTLSSNEEGATFAVELPAQPDAPMPQPMERATVDPKAVRVLVLDDDAGVRKVYSRTLEILGVESVVTGNCDEAVRCFRDAHNAGRDFQVVLLDLTLPGCKDGKMVLDELRTEDPNVRAIVASGYSNAPVLAKYREAGFVGALPKPFTMAAISDALQVALQDSTENAAAH